MVIQNSNVQMFKQLIKKQWYTQGGSGTGIYIIASAFSGFSMKKTLGFGYSKFIFSVENGYVEMRYLNDDFVRLWTHVKERLQKSPEYIEEVKRKYERTFASHLIFLKSFESIDLLSLTDDELKKLVDKIAMIQADSVGISHIIEPISVEGGREFREMLMVDLKNEKLVNKYFVDLILPGKLSFVAEEENDLIRISKLPKNKQDEEINNHLTEYHWIQNSYAGPVTLDKSFFEDRIKHLRKDHKTIALDENVEKVTDDLNLSGSTREMAKVLETVMVWQDERKANILKTIAAFGKVVEEIGRRCGIETVLMTYATLAELGEFTKLDKTKLEHELRERQKGVFYYLDGEEEIVVSGLDYLSILDDEKNIKDEEAAEEIRGMTANRGFVVGKIVVCKDTSSFDKVCPGDILVTSMTRPEFMPILKKVSGIITDEGGITCHAAIVARELGIPAVIGTKNATKILKDGDMVELRANHGVVRILS